MIASLQQQQQQLQLQLQPQQPPQEQQQQLDKLLQNLKAWNQYCPWCMGLEGAVKRRRLPALDNSTRIVLL